jgi:hypothetical protein
VRIGIAEPVEEGEAENVCSGVFVVVEARFVQHETPSQS